MREMKGDDDGRGDGEGIDRANYKKNDEVLFKSLEERGGEN